MAANTPREVVVEIDGLWFRIQALRGRRAYRGTRALQTCLGANGYKTIGLPQFWDSPLETQLEALMGTEAREGASYDDCEKAMVELLAYSPGSRGQGVSYRDTPPDESDPTKGWVAIRTMETLDTFDQVDHLTWVALRWEMIKLCYRPTFAGGGMSAATPSAATTSTQANSPSGKAKTPRGGTQTAVTPTSGISGG